MTPQEKIKKLKKRVREFERDLKYKEEQANALVKKILKQTEEKLALQSEVERLQALLTEKGVGETK